MEGKLMNLDEFMKSFLDEFKETDTFKNLSPAEKDEFKNIVDFDIRGKGSTDRKKKTPLKAISKMEPLSYQLKVSLKGIQPPIWRRILVPNDITFHQLHEIIQIVMGWTNSHLYCFEIGDMEIEIQDDDEAFGYSPTFNEKMNPYKERLGNWLYDEKQKFTYTYDFSDYWEHSILLEKIVKPAERLNYAICLKGKHACPPEDIGGQYGFSRLMDKLNNEGNELSGDDEEFEEWQERYGDFNPEEFDIKEINELLQDMRVIRL